MRRYPVTENFLDLVNRALNGKPISEWELKSVKGSARRYYNKSVADTRKRVTYYNQHNE